MQTMMSLFVGIAIGVGVTLTWAATVGGWYEYRAVRAGDDAEIRQVVERDGCEPFEARGFLFARCPRFRLH